MDRNTLTCSRCNHLIRMGDTFYSMRGSDALYPFCADCADTITIKSLFYSDDGTIGIVTSHELDEQFFHEKDILTDYNKEMPYVTKPEVDDDFPDYIHDALNLSEEEYVEKYTDDLDALDYWVTAHSAAFPSDADVPSVSPSDNNEG